MSIGLTTKRKIAVVVSICMLSGCATKGHLPVSQGDKLRISTNLVEGKIPVVENGIYSFDPNDRSANTASAVTYGMAFFGLIGLFVVLAVTGGKDPEPPKNLVLLDLPKLADDMRATLGTRLSNGNLSQKIEVTSGESVKAKMHLSATLHFSKRSDGLLGPMLVLTNHYYPNGTEYAIEEFSDPNSPPRKFPEFKRFHWVGAQSFNSEEIKSLSQENRAKLTVSLLNGFDFLIKEYVQSLNQLETGSNYTGLKSIVFTDKFGPSSALAFCAKLVRETVDHTILLGSGGTGCRPTKEIIALENGRFELDQRDTKTRLQQAPSQPNSATIGRQ